MIIINGQEDIENFDISSIQNVKELKIINVSNIPEGKFHGLNKLTKVYMNNINIIESGAFMDCKNLKDISFKNNPKEIHDFAFHNTKIGFVPELYENTKFGVYNNLGKNIILEDISWSDLGKLSKLNKCQDYFNIGDKKSIQLTNSTKCQIIIYDFNHDDLSDNSGTANITFGFEDCMGKYALINDHNEHGWQDCELRKILNTFTINLLPLELQTIIKNVNKMSDNFKPGDNEKTLIEVSDKIFLLSAEEVCFDCNNQDIIIHGQGFAYKYFEDSKHRIKNNYNTPTTWRLRSSFSKNTCDYFYITSSGNFMFNDGLYPLSISPCFCI